MREAWGAPASDPPVLTTEVAVAMRATRTRWPVSADTRTWGCGVLNDDLSAPTQGRAKVRVVQASVRTPVLDVAAADGPMIADGVQFATTTEYQQVYRAVGGCG